MGRKRETVKKRIESNDYVADRSIQDPLDFTELTEFTGTVSETEIIVRNENGTGSKVPVSKITEPLDQRIDEVEAVVSTKADKCFAIAMSIVL